MENAIKSVLDSTAVSVNAATRDHGILLSTVWQEWLECVCSRWVHKQCLEDAILHKDQEQFCFNLFSVPYIFFYELCQISYTYYNSLIHFGPICPPDGLLKKQKQKTVIVTQCYFNRK